MQTDVSFHLDHARGDFDVRSRSVLNWATAKLGRFGIAARRPHTSHHIVCLVDGKKFQAS